MLSKFREPVSGLTHLFGAILSILGLNILIQHSVITYKSSLIVFGISLILLYTASSVYHLVSASDKAIMILRRIDHSMIYVLIAGTYTPICMIALKGRLGSSLCAAIWALALTGIILKIFWFNAPRWLYTFFYVFMGWIAIFAIYPLTKAISFSGILWLIAGGVSYTIGAVIYAAKWPKITSELFGFHEIFHIFVLLGSFCHFWMMFKYVMCV